MGMFNRTAKRQQRREHTLANMLPDGWKHLGTRNGKPWYRTAPAIIEVREPVNPVTKVLVDLPLENDHHAVGDVCPHCVGAGRYKNHTTGEVGPCYRCHQKGVLDAKDLAYLERRKKGAGPVCHVRSA